MSPQEPQLATVQSAATYRRIATLFLFLTAAVVGLAAYVIFSRAHAIVLSEPAEVSGEFIIDVARGAVAGEVSGDVFELTDTVSATFPSASVVAIDQPAEGSVRIASTLFRAQTLIATTRLLADDGRLYRIRRTVNVPANGSVEVEAYADEVGAKNEIPAGTTFSIPGLNEDTRRFFTVTATTAFTGGSKEVHMVTQADVDNAAEVLRGKVNASLATKMRETAAETMPDAAARGEFVAVTETSRTLDVPVGSDATEFTLTIDAKATGVFYDLASFERDLRERLKAKLLDGRTLSTIDIATATVTVEKRDLVAGRANLGVAVSGTSAMSAAAPALDPAKLTGISAEAAVAYLESVEGVASASVEVSPFWAGRMPNVASHITVEVR